MINLIKFNKGMLLAASLTFATLSVSANTTPSISQVNTYLISALQQAFSTQVGAMADEFDREIDVAIEQSLIELGLEDDNGGKASNQQLANNVEEQ
jgi:uncharacterized protein YaaN involved in tellurite resistance